MLPLHVRVNDKGSLFNLYLNQIILSYIFQSYKKTVEYLDLAKEDLETEKSSLSTTRGTNETLDLTSILKASQSISREIVLEELLRKLIKTVIENAGAQRGFLILPTLTNSADNEEIQWRIEAEANTESGEVNIARSLPVDGLSPQQQLPLLSTAIVNYVIKYRENVVLNHATDEGEFTRDSYIIATQPKSILCTPLLNQSQLIAILYLENNLTVGSFTNQRLEILKILSSQAAISIENARLYTQLEEYSESLEQKVKNSLKL